MATEIAQKRNLELVPILSCVKAQKDDAVKASMSEGSALGVSATPSMFINGEKLDGALPASEVHAVIDRALRDANQPVPATAAKN
jgi:protein-disulfide isomerase